MGEFVRQDFERIRDIYEMNPLVQKPENIEGCVWRPTPFEILEQESLYTLFMAQNKQLGKDKKILIAGAGDGRRAAYLNRVGFDVYAMEINPALKDASEDIIEKLAKEELINPKTIKVIQGSFLDENVYKSSGIRFSDFTNISAYLLPRNITELGRKIERESPNGTSFMVLSHTDFKDPELSLAREAAKRFKAKGCMTHFFLDTYAKRY